VPSVQPCEIPENALLRKYCSGGSFTDCYVAEVAHSVPLAAFIAHFYTTQLFKVERALLKWFAGLPSTDEQVKELAAGSRDSFAAWRVEGRDLNQLLVSAGRTRSWFMSVPSGPDASGTRLYFGSAVVAKINRKSGKTELGFTFQVLLGFHMVYSRALLLAARARILAATKVAPP
jgi:hypothetical protein